MNQKKLRERKLPISQVGHCDWDYYNNSDFILSDLNALNYKKYTGFNDFGIFGWLIGLGIPIFSAIGMYLWTRLKEAKTQEQIEDIKLEAYKAYRNGDITEEQYKTILLYQLGNAKQLERELFWNKYKYYILGGGGLIALLVLTKLLKK